MNTADFINEAISLPLEERALLADALLQSLNPHEETAICAWLAVAQRRLDEVSSGKVEAIAGDVVFDRIRQRYARYVSVLTRMPTNNLKQPFGQQRSSSLTKTTLGT